MAKKKSPTKKEINELLDGAVRIRHVSFKLGDVDAQVRSDYPSDDLDGIVEKCSQLLKDGIEAAHEGTSNVPDQKCDNKHTNYVG